jgi:hypothetical protein
MALKQAFYYLPLALDCSVRRQCRSLFTAYKSINFLIPGLERLLSGDYGRFARVHVETVGAAVTNTCDKGTHGTSARGESRCKMHPDRDNRRPGIEILVQRSETAAPGPQISASTPGNRHETRTRCPRAPGAHCFNLVKLAINDRTHVVPPSFEYDSSYWCESGFMSDHMALTRIVLSFTVS